MKKLLMLVVILSLVFVGYRVANRDEVNARVAAEIQANPNGERARRSMLVTLQDGRQYPVNFLREGNKVYMGIDGFWWRAFVNEGQPVSVFLRGSEFKGHARTVLNDPAYTQRVFADLRPKWPAWLPSWLNGKLVVIELELSSDSVDSR
ncbi:MAG: hypothetical protein ISP92_07075 [Pseudomonadales bacterium]|jgi:hypothetical protein|nr:hypothetical protein [Pseudomonadales bacterium]MDA0958244.1 hypothetical protein [Pseudomonadota bacterium]